MAISSVYTIVFISLQLHASVLSSENNPKDENSFGKSELTALNLQPTNSGDDDLREIESGSSLGYLYIYYQAMNKPTGLSKENMAKTTQNISESSSGSELLIHNEKTRKEGNESYLKSNESSFERRVKETELDFMKLLIKLDRLKNRYRERGKIPLAEKQTSRTSKPGKTGSQHHKMSAVKITKPLPKKVEGNLEQSFTNNSVNGLATKFEKVKIPKSSKMKLSQTITTEDRELEKQPKLKIDHERIGERRWKYDGITRSVVRKEGAGERGIERVDKEEIRLVGEMTERIKELAIKGSVEQENTGERMTGVGGITKDIKIRQGLVGDAKKRTGEIEGKGMIKERSQEQDGTGYRWVQEDKEGNKVLMKGKEIQNRMKVGKKFGLVEKEIRMQGEWMTKEQKIEFERGRKYGTSGGRRVLVGQGEEQNRIYEARMLAKEGTERVKLVKPKIKEQSRGREDMREKGQHRIQTVKEEKQGLHEVNEGDRRIFLGKFGIGSEELGNYERAKERIKNPDTQQVKVSGEGIVEVREGERGVLGVHGKIQGEIREGKKVGSKEKERDRQGELRIATNIGKLKEIFREKTSDEGTREEGAWRGSPVMGGIKERMTASVEQREADRIGRVDEGQGVFTRTQEGNEEEMKKAMKKHGERVKEQMKSEQIVPRMERRRKEGWDNWLGGLSKQDRRGEYRKR